MRAKPIETYYAGYRFRSRLEARWAIVLDACDYFQWTYEPEGYILANGEPYLPDFLVESFPGEEWGSWFWLEVKPTQPTAEELQKARLLAQGTGINCHLVDGMPGAAAEHVYTPAGLYGVYHPRLGRRSEEDRVRELRRVADENGIELPAPADLPAYGIPYFAIVDYDDPEGGIPFEDTYYYLGIQAARAARFEHGETPGRPGHRR